MNFIKKTRYMRTIAPAIIFFLFILLSACGGSSASENQDPTTTSENAPSTDDLGDAIQQAQQVIQENSQLQEGEPLNFRKLQEILPEKLSGLKRTSSSGQTNGAMGFKISQAEGKYETSSGETLKIEVFDTGGLKMGIMSMAAWATLEMDKEDDRGYERTSMLNGYKAFEKFTKRNQKSEISLLVDERFVIKASGQPFEMEKLKAVVKDLPLRKLK